MAHGDYDCCAVCDNKMAYNSGVATTKEQVRASCAVDLARLGVFVKSGAELLAWMDEAPVAEVLVKLQAAGYGRCFYANPVDDKVAALLAALEAQVSGTPEGKDGTG
jgi:hypothetical protein